MKTMKTRTVATLATVLLLALFGCQSESPTEPSTGGGGGGTTPPTSDISITLTASNTAPLAGSSVLITARATSAGASVVNGTAIEFATSFGTFVETADVYALRTTNSGAATVTLTSAEVGTAVVTARLGSVSKSITINFRVNGGVGPQVSSVVPASGPPSGNQVVTINGSGFKAPVRVFFGSKEATIVSVTETQIKVITPSTNLGASDEFLEVDVRVVSEAGTANEASGTLVKGYRYELQILTPSIIHVSPASGPNEGNTRITIFGEGFQSPAKVFFGEANTQVELDVVSVTFSQIQAITPPASGLGSAFQNNSVDIRVLNLASNKEASLLNAFRYGPAIDITGISPSVGTHLGGDRVTIFGFGFDDPVQVSLSGVPAQVVRVSGTEVVVLSGALLDCEAAGTPGDVVVTNLEQQGDNQLGNTDTFSGYTYLNTMKILSVSPLLEGGAATIVVQDPGPGGVKLSIGGKTVFPTPPPNATPNGAVTFTFTVPTGLEFTTAPCTTGTGATGTQKQEKDFDLVFTNIINGCKATISMPVRPADTSCVTAPTIAVAPPLLTFAADDADGVRDSLALNVTVSNVGSVPVILTAPVAPAPFVIVTPGSLSIPVGSSVVFSMGFNPVAVETSTGTITFAAIGGNSVDVSMTGTGTAVGP